ncbi:MAG: dTMP kinase [Bdellovibrionia bacterium]
MAFLVFEGLDGSGKTTLMKKTSEYLTQSGVKFVITREPGGTPVGEELRNLVLKFKGDTPSAKCEILIYEAARAQHVDQVIGPALARKEWVLCDRFTASTVAFQAGGRALKDDDVKWLNEFATSGLEPDLNVLLDLSTEESAARQKKRFAATGETADRLESEKKDFHERVRVNYLNQAKKNPTRWLVIDASQTPENMFKQLVQRLTEKKWLES